MSQHDLNLPIEQFLRYQKIGDIKARDKIFLQIWKHYREKNVTFFRPLSEIDREELAQEIALALLTRLAKPFKHKNYAATLYNYVRGVVKAWTFKLQEQKRYEIPLDSDNFNDLKFLKDDILKPVIRDYHNKFSELIPALEVIKMYESYQTAASIARHFKCGPHIINLILRLADVPTRGNKGFQRYLTLNDIKEFVRLRVEEKYSQVKLQKFFKISQKQVLLLLKQNALSTCREHK